MDKLLLDRINKIYTESKKLLHSTFSKDYENSGNLAIFSQSKKEYTKYKCDVDKLILPSDNPYQKYFELISPIALSYDEYTDLLTHIYIRKYDPTEYGKYLGDMDFVCSISEYEKLKEDVISKRILHCTMYDRPGWDTIQISKEDSPVVVYLSTKEMAKKARVKFDDLTNL